MLFQIILIGGLIVTSIILKIKYRVLYPKSVDMKNDYKSILKKSKFRSLPRRVIFVESKDKKTYNGKAWPFGVIELTYKTVEDYAKKPRIFKRLLAHEVAHVEFGESVMVKDTVRRIFRETRADLRGSIITTLNATDYISSFDDEEVRIFQTDLKYYQSGYLPPEKRKEIIKEFHDIDGVNPKSKLNYEMAYTKLIKFLNEEKINITEDCKNKIISDCKNAHMELDNSIIDIGYIINKSE